MSDYAENTAENDENKIPVNIITGFLGSGKTTLLNRVGGLDHYDSGDLVINSVSTKEYNDRD